MQSGNSSQNISGGKKLGLAARKIEFGESCELRMYSFGSLLINLCFSPLYFFPSLESGCLGMPHCCPVEELGPKEERN